MTIGDRLRDLRLKQNISQVEMGQYLDITRSAYSHYETNYRQPSYENLKKLSFLFNESIDYIINGDQLIDPETHVIEIIRVLNRMDQDKRKQYIENIMAVIGL